MHLHLIKFYQLKNQCAHFFEKIEGSSHLCAHSTVIALVITPSISSACCLAELIVTELAPLLLCLTHAYLLKLLYYALMHALDSRLVLGKLWVH